MNRYSSCTKEGNCELVYSYKKEDWRKCSRCHKKFFKVIESKGSTIEIKCKCGSIENVGI